MSTPCIYSEQATTQLNKDFPNISKENPKFNLNVQVELFVNNERIEENNVHVQSTTDILRTVLQTAEFMGDNWLDNIENEDDLSVSDLEGAVVTLKGQEYYVQFELKTKTVKSTKE
jgi:hypothetical protein